MFFSYENEGKPEGDFFNLQETRKLYWFTHADVAYCTDPTCSGLRSIGVPVFLMASLQCGQLY